MPLTEGKRTKSYNVCAGVCARMQNKHREKHQSNQSIWNGKKKKSFIHSNKVAEQVLNLVRKPRQPPKQWGWSGIHGCFNRTDQESTLHWSSLILSSYQIFFFNPLIQGQRNISRCWGEQVITPQTLWVVPGTISCTESKDNPEQKATQIFVYKLQTKSGSWNSISCFF